MKAVCTAQCERALITVVVVAALLLAVGLTPVAATTHEAKGRCQVSSTKADGPFGRAAEPAATSLRNVSFEDNPTHSRVHVACPGTPLSDAAPEQIQEDRFWPWPDCDAFPDFCTVKPRRRVVLSPGDTLVIPQGWWHWIVSDGSPVGDDMTVALNLWFSPKLEHETDGTDDGDGSSSASDGSSSASDGSSSASDGSKENDSGSEPQPQTKYGVDGASALLRKHIASSRDPQILRGYASDWPAGPNSTVWGLHTLDNLLRQPGVADLPRSIAACGDDHEVYPERIRSFQYPITFTSSDAANSSSPPKIAGKQIPLDHFFEALQDKPASSAPTRDSPSTTAPFHGSTSGFQVCFAMFQLAPYTRLLQGPDRMVPPGLQALARAGTVMYSNIWAARGRLQSGLHYDEFPNLLTVLRGQKRVTLFAPEDSPCLSPIAPYDKATTRKERNRLRQEFRDRMKQEQEDKQKQAGKGGGVCQT